MHILRKKKLKTYLFYLFLVIKFYKHTKFTYIQPNIRNIHNYICHINRVVGATYIKELYIITAKSNLVFMYKVQ